MTAFFGNLAGGFYSVARDLIGLLQIPVLPLPSTTYPELSRTVAQRNWGGMRHILRRGTRLAAIYSLPVALFLVIFGKWVIYFYTGGTEALPAYPLLMILLAGYTFSNLFYWGRAALLALNRPVFPTVVNFIGMVIKVVLIFVLVEQFQYYAFAGLLSFYYIFTVGIAAVRVRLDLRGKLAQESAA